jgi:NAD+ kinase
VKVRNVAIVTHPGKDQAVAMAEDLGRWLQGQGMAVTEDDPDLVVSLGGDGTMLRAARLAHAADAPLLGVNMGALGYLTEVDAGGEQAALKRVFDGEYELEERMMLSCSAKTKERAESFVGLNEVLVERASRHRLVRLGVRIGGEALAAFNADGVIVATPTGSTAYALSAGGPIVSPRAECLVVVPVSPHMIFSRPIVVSADETVEISVDPGGGDAYLSLDGALGGELDPGSGVSVGRHPRPLRLLRLSGPGFLERLRSKLDLPG